MMKVPREGLADLLAKLAEHARTYVMTGLSVHFDGTMYRVVVEGEGELLLSQGDDKGEKPNDSAA
jgi:hypothetical protein